jgi:hypothetical protein
MRRLITWLARVSGVQAYRTNRSYGYRRGYALRLLPFVVAIGEAFDALGVLDSALRDVNRWRRATGRWPLLMLPRGWLNSVRQCPLARVFGADVDGVVAVFGSNRDALAAARAWHTDGWDAQHGMARAELPRSLSTFVTAFDRGQYPFLVKRPPVSDAF